MEITAELVKKLREKTGVGLMDCKEALKHAAGDTEKAIEYLREKGLAKLQKRMGKVASEGGLHPISTPVEKLAQWLRSTAKLIL